MTWFVETALSKCHLAAGTEVDPSRPYPERASVCRTDARKTTASSWYLSAAVRCLRPRPTPSWPSLLGRTTTVEGPAFALVELSLCSPSGSSRDRVCQMFTPVPNQDRFAMVSRKRIPEPALTPKRWNSCLFAIPTPIGCSLPHVAIMAPHLESRRLVSFPVSFPLHS